METIADTAKLIMNTLENRAEKQLSNHGKCLSCGTEFTWNDNQWHINCPGCGNVILRKIKAMMAKKPTKCWLCMDTGIVTYEAQQDGIVSEYGAACSCDAGKQFPGLIKVGEGLLCPFPWRIVENNKKLSKVI